VSLFPHPRRRGLSLIELLAVIAILAALTGLVVPVVGLVRTAAQRFACAHNLGQVGAVLMLYANDHDDLLPGSRLWGVNDPARSIAWFHRLPPYLDQKQVPKGGTIFQCPGFHWQGPRAFASEVPKSYKMNSYIDSDGNRYRPFALGGASDAAELVLFVDATTGTGMGQWGHAPPSAVDDSRHRGFVNVLYADGHTTSTVKTPPARIWTPVMKWRSDDWTGR
jgi:prepilin-type N-terminal cleavage/methylation domain-containing protein/prepilin-type processing-associated H-X9-DG protein